MASWCRWLRPISMLCSSFLWFFCSRKFIRSKTVGRKHKCKQNFQTPSLFFCSAVRNGAHSGIHCGICSRLDLMAVMLWLIVWCEGCVVFNNCIVFTYLSNTLHTVGKTQGAFQMGYIPYMPPKGILWKQSCPPFWSVIPNQNTKKWSLRRAIWKGSSLIPNTFEAVTPEDKHLKGIGAYVWGFRMECSINIILYYFSLHNNTYSTLSCLVVYSHVTCIKLN